MGHNVSKGKSSQNENLVRDIAYLREKTHQQEKTIEVLNNERKLLEARTAAQTKELEKIKEENKKLKNDLNSVITTSESPESHVRSDSDDSAHASIEDTQTELAVQEPEQENPVLTDEELSDTDSGVEHGTQLKIGDKVLSLHVQWSYYTASIVHFDSASLMYTVDWDDGDPSGRVQKYCDVALDKTPSEDEIGVGTLVLFPQGQYGGTAGNNSGGVRYHQGRITRVRKNHKGTTLYDGVHTKGAAEGKWVTYRDYSYEFHGLRLHDLRVSPNIYDILNAEDNSGQTWTTREVDSDNLEYDVFMSYSKLNSNIALENGEQPSDDLGKSIEEHKVLNRNSTDPRWIKQQLEKKGLRVWMDESRDELELNQMVNIMKQCKVIIACISNEYAHSDNTRMELQFSKKTIKKPILPIVVGGGEWEWQMTVVGLLIAGELYIDFTNSSEANAKTGQLVQALDKHIHIKSEQTNSSPEKPIAQKDSPQVFISYCWTNSYAAYEAKEIKQVIGNKFNDPRRIYDDLASRNITGWLDIHQLTSAATESIGMFEQIARGLTSARLVLVFVSDEYSQSDNCRMEFQFALKSLKKKVVPVVIGTGAKWTNTIIGMLVSGCEAETIDMRTVTEANEYETKFGEILKYFSHVKGENYQTPAKERTYRAPKIGDKVICHHFKWAYFPATIVEFNKATFEYTVDWDDGDRTGREESYKNVALNSIPRQDEIAEGTTVFFPQGSYSGSEGNNSGGVRYHEGRITKVYKNSSGDLRYDGVHTKGIETGKWITYQNYSYSFTGMRLEDLRIAPNAMDALMAIEQQARQM